MTKHENKRQRRHHATGKKPMTNCHIQTCLKEKLEIQGNVKLFQKPDTWFVMQLGDMPISSLLVALMDALERL